MNKPFPSVYFTEDLPLTGVIGAFDVTGVYYDKFGYGEGERDSLIGVPIVVVILRQGGNLMVTFGFDDIICLREFI